MILFKEDWNRFPTAIPDFKTTNRSFLEYAEKLRLMGCSNYLFCLSLLNPQLQGVDPFSKHLSKEIKALIFTECKYNIWYYLREVYRVVPMASAVGIQFGAHRGNMAYAWGCMLHLSVGLTLPRQLGKSVVADAVNQWTKDIAARNTNIILVTKDDDLRKKNIIRLKKARQLLPTYISNISKKDADNSFEMTNLLLGNSLTTAIGQPSIEGANKAARGLTSPAFQFDEPPFTKNIKIMLTAALPAYVTASEEAKQYGNPYYVGYTTTAGKIDDKDGAFMYKIFHEGMWFDESLYDCNNREQVVNRIRRNSTGDDTLIYINFLHYQLGKTDEWLYSALGKTHSFGQEADRDYFNIWTNGTAEHPLSKKIVDAIVASRQDPKYIQLFEREYSIRWFVSENQLRDRVRHDQKMIVGIDMSEGIGRDLISFVIVAEEDLGVLGIMVIKETNILNFIDWVCDVMVKYPNLIIIPENKSTGVVLVDALLVKLPALGIDPVKRIYNRIVDENLITEERYAPAFDLLSKRPMSFYERNKTMFGYRTSGGGHHARNKLYVDALQKAGNYGGDKVRDAGLSSEILSLSVKDGRIDHKSGLHDDRVIGWLLAVWMLGFSRNLAFYGIKSPLIHANDLSKNTDDEIPPTEYELHVRKKEDGAKTQIAINLDKLHQTNDPIIVEQIKRRIIALEKNLSTTDKLPKSINELIGDALEMRRNRLYNSRSGANYNKPKSRAYYVA